MELGFLGWSSVSSTGCPIPPDLDVFGAWQKIKESLSKMNYRGESSIYVYGDIEKIKSGIKLEKYDVEQLDDEQLDDEPEVISPQIVVEDYFGTEAIYAGEMTAGNPKIVVNHTPEGRGNANHVKILADVLFWTLDNEGPTNLILIVGRLTTEHYLFELGVSKLCLLGYNVVVALPENVPDRQTRFETILRWEDLLLGNFSAGEISSPGNSSAGESSRLKRKDPPT